MRTEIVIKRVSDEEFFAAHNAYIEMLNNENPADFDEDESLAKQKAYWGISEYREPKVETEVVETKSTIMSKVKSVFGF